MILQPEPSVEDALAAIAGDYCPFCGQDRPAKAQVGPRRRCRSCLARWEQLESCIRQIPCPDQAMMPVTSPQTVAIPLPAAASGIDRIAQEVESFRRSIN